MNVKSTLATLAAAMFLYGCAVDSPAPDSSTAPADPTASTIPSTSLDDEPTDGGSETGTESPAPDRGTAAAEGGASGSGSAGGATGLGVCTALKAAVASGDAAATGLSRYADADVLDELTVDADGGYTIALSDMRVWTETSGQCVMTAAFNEEFVLTLASDPRGGQRATAITVRSAQRAPVSYRQPNAAAQADDGINPETGMPYYLVGAAVCKALLPAVTEGRTTGPILELRATRQVLATLAEDTKKGYPAEGAYASDGDTRNTCQISADNMGDAWYELTLEGMDGDIGQKATSVRTRTSYD